MWIPVLYGSGSRNFDWDDDGKILVVSRYKQGLEAAPLKSRMTGLNQGYPLNRQR